VRSNLREATHLLKEAGFEVRDRKLVDQTGKPVSVEFLNESPSMERLMLFYKTTLERIGITVSVRTVDDIQYENRLRSFDFDLTSKVWAQSLSPGNEQREFWGSKAADEQGSRNVLGIKNPVIDELIEELIKSPDRASLVAHTHALDRVLQYGYYVVPQFHLGAFWVAYWDKFRRPEIAPKYGLGIDTWWVDPKAEQAIEAKKGEVKQ
jgi:microcin C transport system substrate-binding protein